MITVTIFSQNMEKLNIFTQNKSFKFYEKSIKSSEN